jgi:hypothetical protein
MGDFAKADREVVRVVERIHVRVMSDAAGVVREVPEQAVPEPRNTTGNSVDTSSHDSKPESHHS